MAILVDVIWRTASYLFLGGFCLGVWALFIISDRFFFFLFFIHRLFWVGLARGVLIFKLERVR